MAFLGYSDVGESGSKLEKIFLGRKSGLFSKWHVSGLKISDPVLKIGNNGTYELCDPAGGQHKQKINFKGLQDGGVDFKVEKKADGYTCGFTKKTSPNCTAEYEVESKNDALSHACKFDGKVGPINGFVKLSGECMDPTAHISWFTEVPKVSGLKLVMDCKSKVSDMKGCKNITGLHYSGLKNCTVACTVQDVCSAPMLGVDCEYTQGSLGGGCQLVYGLKSSELSFTVAGTMDCTSGIKLAAKANKNGQIALQIKKAFSPSFNLEMGCLTSASDLADPKGLKDSLKMGLKLNLKF